VFDNACVLIPPQVHNCSVSLPGKPAVELAAYAAATASRTANTAAPITVVNIKASDLEVVVVAATAPTGPAVNLARIVDTQPPVITLAGSVFMPLLQSDQFVDPGVRVHDNIDGNALSAITRLQLCARPATSLDALAANDSRPLTGCGPQLAAINTTVPLRDNETYVLSYTARDTAGNQAAPARRYVTIASRCAPPERWCPDITACSVQGLCLRGLPGSSSISTSGSTSPAAAAFVAPIDKTPPKLVLLGSGSAAVTATGAVVLRVNVTWKAAWRDPGARAVDAVDGDLTASIQSFGAAGVDMRVPTAPGAVGYVVEYFVEDKSKNAVPIARRLVRVVCPATESYCIDPDTSKPTCTSKGVCALAGAGGRVHAARHHADRQQWQQQPERQRVSRHCDGSCAHAARNQPACAGNSAGDCWRCVRPMRRQCSHHRGVRAWCGGRGRT
jgi:hypothetical protein